MSHEEAEGLSAALKRLGEIVRDGAELAEDRHAFEFTGLVSGNDLQRRRARQARGERLSLLESTELALGKLLTGGPQAVPVHLERLHHEAGLQGDADLLRAVGSSDRTGALSVTGCGW